MSARFGLFVCLVAVSACGGLRPTGGEEAVPRQILVPVAFYTDRNIDDVADPEHYFGGERGAASYGVASVGISTSKQGHSAVADWRRWRAVEENPKNANRVLEITPLAGEEFAGHLDRAVANSDDRSVVVYIHGYFRTFNTVVRNTAILTFELNLRGVPILYSWPSLGYVGTYTEDRANVDWSSGNLERFLRQLMHREDIETIHIVAHSLGNRGFLRAFANILSDESESANWKFGEIILVAPDVDAGVFERHYAPLLGNMPSRATLYVSALDVPLSVSEKVNRGDRIGDASEQVPVFDGIETIDVSPVTSILTGHVPHREEGQVQADLHYLINDRLAADDRPTVTAVASEGGRYWRVKTDRVLETGGN